MYGKMLRVSEYELKFGSKEQMVNVFVCFKYKKNGSNYLVYSKVGEELTGKVYYGLVHIGNQKLISMEPKEGDSEIIKELVWKLFNKESLDDYEILVIGDISKIEIIASNYLDMKPQVVKELIDLTIPKKKEIINDDVSKNKKNSKVKIFILLFMVILGVGGYLFYSNMGELFGYGTMLECTYQETNNKLDANVIRKITIYYDRDDRYERLVDNTAYVFDDYEDYNEFKQKGHYFEYQPIGEVDGGNSFEDENNTFRTIVNASNDKIYFVDDLALPGNISEDSEQLNKKGYTCVSQNREE